MLPEYMFSLRDGSLRIILEADYRTHTRKFDADTSNPSDHHVFEEDGWSAWEIAQGYPNTDAERVQAWINNRYAQSTFDSGEFARSSFTVAFDEDTWHVTAEDAERVRVKIDSGHRDTWAISGWETGEKVAESIYRTAPSIFPVTTRQLRREETSC